MRMTRNGPSGRSLLPALPLLLLAIQPPEAGAEVATGGGLSAGVQAAPEERPSADTLTLDAAVRAAVAGSPDVASAQASLDAAGAARLADWGAFLPTATANASFSRNEFTTVTFQDPTGASQELPEPLTGVRKSSFQGLSFRWSLLQGGERIAGYRAGGERLEASRRRLSSAERSAAADAAGAYLEALKRQRLVEVAARQLEARRRDLEMTRRRYEVAAADRTDLVGARADVADAELAVLETREAARSSRGALRVSMGREGELPSDAVLADVEELPPAEGLDADRLAERALSRHPELRALEAEAAAASAERWAARARYLPDVTVGYSLTRSEALGPEGSFFVLDPSNTGQGLSLGLSWSLFGGFSRREQEARSAADLRRARAQRTKRELEVEKAVRDRVEEIRRRASRLKILRRKEELARERVELAREQYRLGALDFFDLQAAVERLTGAERERIRERYDYLLAWVELERRAGDLEGRGLSALRSP